MQNNTLPARTIEDNIIPVCKSRKILVVLNALS